MEYEHYLSSKFEEAEKHAAEQGLKLRRYNPNSLITADYHHDRLNVETDENDIIVKIVGIG